MKKRKILSSVLAASMVLSMVPVTALAVDGDDGSQAQEVKITNATELAQAIAGQQDGQVWKLAEGTYNLTEAELALYADKVCGGQTDWYFPLTANNLTIIGEGDVTITSDVESPNANWATQDFVSVWGNDITIDNVDILSKDTQNKAIEVMGQDFTLKNSEMKRVNEWGSGSIIFNSQAEGGDIGTATLENVKLYSWISTNYSKTGTLNTSNVTVDFTDNSYAGYKDETYGFGWCPGIFTSRSEVEVNNDNLTLLVDDKINLAGQVLNTNAQSDTTVVLEAGTYHLDSNMVINKDITVVGAGEADTTLVAYENQTVQNDSRIKVADGAQVKFEGMTFTASYGADTVAPIIGVSDTGKLELNHCTITDSSVGYSSGYGLINTGSAEEGSKVTMKNCTVNSVIGSNDTVTYYVLGQGGVCELDIQDNTFNLGSWFMFNIQANGIMKNNVFNGVDGASGRVVNSTQLKGLKVEGNTFAESLYGTRFVIGGDYAITGNTFEALGDDLAIGIYDKPDTTAEISNNVFTMDDGSYGIRVTNLWGGEAGDLSSLILHNNTFDGTGIYEFRNDTWTGTVDLSDSEASEEFAVKAGAETTIKLPDAVEKEGYVFQGWSDGTNTYDAGEEVTITKDTTFTAVWSVISSGTSYSITVEDSDNGSVTASRTRANKGLTITLTVKADEGYKLDTIAVTDKDGNEVKLTDKGDGKYTFAMPASAVTVKASFAKDDAPVDTGLPFTDVKADDWFFEAVKYVYDNKLMDGTSATTFAPLMTTNRAMIVTILWRLEGQPETDATLSFTDVESGVWYTDAVNWAASKGIVKGYSDTVFAPNDTVTREQLATILYRYAESKGYDVTAKGDLTTFADGANTSSWAAEAMEWAVGSGLLSGKDGGKLDPTGTATRAEVATILMRFVESVSK